MDINRDNYQIFITDFFDKGLNRIEEDALMRFLDENPDLRAEFDDFDNFSLHPDISVRISKSDLKRDLSHLNKENLEAYAIAITENDVEENQAQELKMILESTPGGKEMLADYSRIKLVPQNIGYPDKRGLKRIPVKKSIYRMVINGLSVAASIAIIVSLFLVVRNKPTYGDGPFNASVQFSFNKSLLNAEINGNKRLITHLSAGRVQVEPFTDKKSLEKPGPLITIEREIVHISPVIEKPDVFIPLEKQQYMLASVTFADIPDIAIRDLSPRQFVARSLRKYIIKEDINSVEKLRVHEMADAGIIGVNKLLGWEMTLEKERTEDGTLSAYKFTSQLINFDRKVKKGDD